MPSSIRQPECAIHFGFLQSIHDRKLQPLTQGVLNKFTLFTGSERTMITTDGNFSQKRHKCALNAPEPFSVDQVGELWGTAEDVKRFDRKHFPAGDCLWNGSGRIFLVGLKLTRNMAVATRKLTLTDGVRYYALKKMNNMGGYLKRKWLANEKLIEDLEVEMSKVSPKELREMEVGLTVIKLIHQCHQCHATFTDAGNLMTRFINIEGFKNEKHLNNRRKSTKAIVFYKATRGDTEPDNLNNAFACPNCTEYFDTEELFEDHYKQKHLSEKRPHEGDQVILAHKKQCFNISTVHNTTLNGPKFKYTDIARLKPFVRMAIESNTDISEEDAHIIQDNLDHQQKLKTLSQYPAQMSLIRDCLALNSAREILHLVWTRAVEDSNSTN
ncbi:hypothetical protein INT47_002489 [Mucor saturninus]|uniref:C2H2-type domain-containing protein n=1 Tax=Mucor saturninus TaxID=64648 RepID=A0A8H7V9J2_9FUNG|nr:hypothetical protein INT47_002489 [Mucor saturninus]